MKFHINLTVTQYDKSKDVIVDDSIDGNKVRKALDDCTMIADAEMTHGTASRLVITVDRI